MSWDLRKIHECFLSETFSICCWNQRIAKTKFQTNGFFRTCFRSFFHFSNERALGWCRNYLITWCISSFGVESFLYKKTSRQWLSGETDSIYGRKHWVTHQIFLTNQASLRVAKLQVSFYFPKTVSKTSICKTIRKSYKQSPDVEVSQLEYTFSFHCCL